MDLVELFAVIEMDNLVEEILVIEVIYFVS